MDNVLKEIMKKFKKSFYHIFLFTMFINLLILTAPFYMLGVYDVVMPSKNIDTLLFITILALTLFISMGVLEHLRGKILNAISHNLDVELNPLIYEISIKRALKNPSLNQADLLNDIHTIKNFISSPSILAILDAPWFPLYIFIMFLFSPFYALYAIIATIIIFILTIINHKINKKNFEKINSLYKKNLNDFNTQLQNAEVIEVLGMRNTLYKKWQESYHKFLEINYHTTNKNSFYSNFSKSFRIMSSSLMYGVGALLAINNLISPGMIIAGAVLLSKSLGPITQIVGAWKHLINTKESYKKLQKAIKEYPLEENRLSLPEIKGEITLKNVSVFQENKKPILKNINLHINPNETIGIIGENGSGKTSLIKTILGIYVPNIGEVRLDNAEINQYNKEELGKQIGYLPQDIELFEGTIAENIARFTSFKDEDVVKAAQLAGCHEMILKMPNGYNTFLKANAKILSAGQRQKIGLARAFYKNPKLIILDEPNSNMDDKGEIALIKAILSLKNQSTILIISHKMSLLNITDKIAYVKDGEIKLFDEKLKILNALKGNR